jgi:hypothetical protein
MGVFRAAKMFIVLQVIFTMAACKIRKRPSRNECKIKITCLNLMEGGDPA